MTFKDLPIAQTFRFAEPVGFSMGQTFVKISQRKYVQILRPGVVVTPHYRVGTINVRVVKIV